MKTFFVLIVVALIIWAFYEITKPNKRVVTVQSATPSPKPVMIKAVNVRKVAAAKAKPRSRSKK